MHDDEKRSDRHMLVVEDDEETREALVVILQMRATAPWRWTTGGEAIDYLAKSLVPDLIILDLWIPIMDGWQFRSEQVKDPRLARVPVIVVTALGDRAEVGAEIMIKPVDLDRLLMAIDQYCRREPAP